MEKITYGLAGLLSVVILAFGGTILLSQDELDHAYVCTTNENVAFFDKLSSTSKTGYYVDENNISQSIVCRNGFWIKLEEYAKSKGISVDALLKKGTVHPSITVAEIGKHYMCDQQKCEVI